MSRFALAALIVAVSVASAAAQVASVTAVCRPDAELDQKVFALWVTPGTNPDAVPCAAMLHMASCAASAAGETRLYASPDGAYTAILTSALDGAVTVSLQLVGASGVGHGAVELAVFNTHRVFYRGVGADQVQVQDQDTGEMKSIGNVMLIPAENLTDNGRAMCPAQ